ncbi:hypothetical protein A3218_25770 [Pseudomonas chlororaphis]|nr:hypothetical protein A3218_25770 [Pseudomonas chlororaphis]
MPTLVAAAEPARLRSGRSPVNLAMQLALAWRPLRGRSQPRRLVSGYRRDEHYRRLKGLEQQPTRRQMIEIGLSLRPHRTVAAWYLWRVPAR